MLKEFSEPYWLACKKAAAVVIETAEIDLEKKLYPYWVNAIHELILSNYCPCQKQNHNACFLSFNKDIQKKLISERMPLLDFEHFVQMWKIAKKK